MRPRLHKDAQGIRVVQPEERNRLDCSSAVHRVVVEGMEGFTKLLRSIRKLR